MGGQEERYVGDCVNEGPVQLCPVLRVVIKLPRQTGLPVIREP